MITIDDKSLSYADQQHWASKQARLLQTFVDASIRFEIYSIDEIEEILRTSPIFELMSDIDPFISSLPATSLLFLVAKDDAKKLKIIENARDEICKWEQCSMKDSPFAWCGYISSLVLTHGHFKSFSEVFDIISLKELLGHFPVYHMIDEANVMYELFGIEKKGTYDDYFK